MTRLQQLLGIDLPIIQAPMAGVQGSVLAAAVSNAGGLGSLPCAMLGPSDLRKELVALTGSTSRPYNVNFFCHTRPSPDEDRQAAWRALLAPFYAELGVDVGTVAAAPDRAPFSAEATELLAEFRPPVVSFHFGLPADPLIARIRQWGCRILASATTVGEALWLQARGVDAVIAQGLEAGGHRGHFLSPDLGLQMGTMALVPQIVQAVSCPVIAAGGIADAAGVRAALALGASGVQLGTAFLLCPEATTSALHRAALKGDAAAHTALTNLYTGRPARGIVTRLMREIGPINAMAPEFPQAASALAPLRTKAEAGGSSDFSPLWSGQNASGCRDIPAAELLKQLALGIAHTD
jgi:nitronate monooxygenase